MLKIYNELLRINHLIITSFVCGFQLINKKKFILYLFLIILVDPLILTIILSLFNLHINLTSQSSLYLIIIIIIVVIIYNLYSSPPCGLTSVLPGYLLL